MENNSELIKKGLSTDEVFRKLLNNLDVWKRTGRPLSQRHNLSWKLKNGIHITQNLKIKLLREAGQKPIQETIWDEFPPLPKTKKAVKPANQKAV